MSEAKLPVADTSQENDYLQIHPELPQLAVARAIWTGIILEHHRQSPFETPIAALLESKTSNSQLHRGNLPA